jgi:hypothetical protein
MKNFILIMVLGLSSLFVSAQNLMVVSTIEEPVEGAEWSVDNFTNNIGVAYKVNDNCYVGLVKVDDNYDLYGRHNLNLENMYLTVQAPTEDLLDNVVMGVGYTYNVWKGIAIEPNYTMNLKSDDTGDHLGSFNFGLSYKF